MYWWYPNSQNTNNPKKAASERIIKEMIYLSEYDFVSVLNVLS